MGPAVVAVSILGTAIWEPEKRTPEEWSETYGLLVLDPDGWRVPGAPDWAEPVSLAEFYHRALESTTNGLVTGAFERIREDLDKRSGSAVAR